MSFTPGSKRGQMADINMTPLIDVMLVLLIIFMVAAPMLTTGLDVKLPEAKSGKSLDSEALTVTVDASGTIEVGKDRVLITALEKRLRERSGNNLKRPILVQADKNLNYGKVMEVVDQIRVAGFTTVGFVTNATVPPREK